ncbi:MAG: J domain-containing protein [Cyclobacteriaceae bacterium]|nr:MAG: J domain-containing protein [Cyclobacteriaceae bacterium]
MKNYYFILGLTIYAHAQEVKRAYRKLALQYHPDRNPSAEAAAIFIEVNEAYEVLSDPQRKLEYDQLLQGVPSQPPPFTSSRDPRFRRGPVATESASSRREVLNLMREYLKHAVMFSRLALLFSFVLIADLSLPTKAIREEILEVTPKHDSRYDRSSQLALQDGETITLKMETAREFQKGSVITIHTSSLFSVPLTLENEKTRYKSKVMVSIYGNFKFLPIAMLITSLLGTFWWKGIEFRFNLGVVSAILILLNFIFLRIHSL